MAPASSSPTELSDRKLLHITDLNHPHTRQDAFILRGQKYSSHLFQKQGGVPEALVQGQNS